MRTSLAIFLYGLGAAAAAAGSGFLRGSEDQDARPTLSVNLTDIVMGANKAPGGTYTLSISPAKEDQRIGPLGGPMTGGKVEMYVRSGAVGPGIITSAYVANAEGRNSFALGSQDEIDLEWKGNDPTRVQTNVFLSGAENLQLISVGGDSSTREHLYGFEWDARRVIFTIDGGVVRTVPLSRPLAGMYLYISLWTTSGGWQGVKQWAGEVNWAQRGGQPVTASFNIVRQDNIPSGASGPAGAPVGGTAAWNNPILGGGGR